MRLCIRERDEREMQSCEKCEACREKREWSGESKACSHWYRIGEERLRQYEGHRAITSDATLVKVQ